MMNQDCTNYTSRRLAVAVVHLDAHRPVVTLRDGGQDMPQNAAQYADAICAGIRMAKHADGFPGCTGPCDQGRKLCVTPEACRRADPEDVHRWELLLILLAYLFSGWRGIALVLLGVPAIVVATGLGDAILTAMASVRR